ncbi:DUF6653 family protein [Primorskyibacter sp. S187A]|uniref:DUF6653 family protein n=1 Tax=Primorskyibacter sp. S187A TaxID=3415130 RepID=UPI003C799734
MRKISLTERLMAMNEDTWDKHANPWSGWSRLSIPPLLAAAIWSRDWLGLWALGPLALVLVWTWWNPRAFAKPEHLDNWMSKGVLGERIWLNRAAAPLPEHHRRAPHVLAWVSASGLGPLTYGLWVLDLWATLLGLVLLMGGKLWFIDRMVWLHTDTQTGQTRASA